MPDTPEQIAADRIARLEAERQMGERWRDLTDQQRADYLAAGRRAVEALSAAGLVILPAARVAEWLEREPPHA